MCRSWMRSGIVRFVVVIPLLLLSACDQSEVGAVVFEFSIDRSDATFRAAVSDLSLIDAARAELALPVSERNFINGPIQRGDGGHNTGWSWSFIEDDWELVEVSIELCDGNPEDLEADLDYWVDTGNCSAVHGSSEGAGCLLSIAS